MQFYMPVKVFEEENCVAHHAEEIASLGTRALLITGKHSSRINGSLADVTDVLKGKGIPYAVYDDVEENPSVETVMKARDFGLSEGADFLIGIGGGSAMDCCKAVALMMAHREEDEAYLYKAETDSAALPIALVPTTCGTGSEVTAVSVLTIHAKKTKGSIAHRIFARYAFIDGKYLKTASAKVLCNTAVDALSHLWESCLSSKATDYSRMCVHAGLTVWSRSRDILEGKREPDGDDYANMMRASAFGGMAIAQTGTSLPHGLSYPLTYDLHMAHGAAVGYFQAGYMAEASEEDRKYMLQTAGFRDLAEWQKFYATVCGGVKVDSAELRHAADVLASNPAKLANAPFPVDRNTLERIVFFA